MSPIPRNRPGRRSSVVKASLMPQWPKAGGGDQASYGHAVTGWCSTRKLLQDSLPYSKDSSPDPLISSQLL